MVQKIVKPILPFECEHWARIERHQNTLNALEMRFLKKIGKKQGQLRHEKDAQIVLE